MKPIRTLSIFFAALLVVVAAAPAAPGTNPAWEKMKSLVGEWEGTMTHGEMNMPVKVSYSLVSGGTSLMERMNAPDDSHDMVTMYYPDGSRIMMTHYCSEGNQPRMRANASSADGSLAFNFVDATGLASPQAEHMRKLVVRFQDPNHFTQEWTHRKGGKEETGVFKYARKK
ncbi:MAG TPA: hypothetical protein VGS98_07340 [Thermoanaerobaculia bacterium]|jgi:hypothetical protein|nr:hypothetical protein [Thermoanaerobaculia bacterium]